MVKKPMFDAENFARDIRLKLADRNMSKKDAAKEMDVNASTLTRITADGKTPDVENYLRIQKWLGRTMQATK